MDAFTNTHHALVVSCNYTGASNARTLSGTDEDAKAMHVWLGELGYDVTLLRETDQVKPTPEEVMEWFAQRVLGETVLFYFSGHGFSLRGRSTELMQQGLVLFARDGGLSLLTEDFFRDHVIPKCSGSCTQLIFDCCHSAGMTKNVFGDVARGKVFEGELPAGVSIAPITACPNSSSSTNGYVMLSAAAPDDVAYERSHDGKTRGMFTVALLEVLKASEPAHPTWDDVCMAVNVILKNANVAQIAGCEGETLWRPLSTDVVFDDNNKTFAFARDNGSWMLSIGAAAGVSSDSSWRIQDGRDKPFTLSNVDAVQSTLSLSAAENVELQSKTKILCTPSNFFGEHTMTILFVALDEDSATWALVHALTATVTRGLPALCLYAKQQANEHPHFTVNVSNGCTVQTFDQELGAVNHCMSGTLPEGYIPWFINMLDHIAWARSVFYAPIDMSISNASGQKLLRENLEVKYSVYENEEDLRSLIIREEGVQPFLLDGNCVVEMNEEEWVLVEVNGWDLEPNSQRLFFNRLYINLDESEVVQFDVTGAQDNYIGDGRGQLKAAREQCRLCFSPTMLDNEFIRGDGTQRIGVVIVVSTKNPLSLASILQYGLMHHGVLTSHGIRVLEREITIAEDDGRQKTTLPRNVYEVEESEETPQIVGKFSLELKVNRVQSDSYFEALFAEEMGECGTSAGDGVGSDVGDNGERFFGDLVGAYKRRGRVATTKLHTIVDGDGDRDSCGVDIILVHGLFGHHEKTWNCEFGGDGIKLWPRELVNGSTRLFSLAHEGGIGIASVQNIANKSLCALDDAGVWDKSSKRKVVFVTHSLGGLVVKQLWCQSKTWRKRTQGIVFFGTPHNGSSLATWLYRTTWCTRKIMKSTCNLKLNKRELVVLQKQFAGWYKLAAADNRHPQLLNFREGAPAIQVVSPDSSGAVWSGIDVKNKTTDFMCNSLNHSTIKAPADKDALQFIKLASLLETIAKDNTSTNEDVLASVVVDV